MLDQRLVQLMQRLLEEAAPSTPLRAVSRRLKDDFNIGRVKGQTLHLGERDRELIRELLVAGGHAVTRVDLKSLSRSDRLAAGTPYEKAGGGALKSGRVSIKALAGKTLDVAGKSLSLPDRSHVDIEWRRIVGDSGHNAIMLVENYEVFDHLDDLVFDLPGDCANPLAVYRGDRHESRQDNVKAFLAESSLPVLAFVDIDPKGLHIAGCCPRLRGVVAPEVSALEATLANPASARTDLYVNQLPGVEGFLRSAKPNSPIGRLWAVMQIHRAGAVQERWLADSTTCGLWGNDMSSYPARGGCCA